MPKSTPPTDKDYAQLGKSLERVLIRDNIRIIDNWKRFVLTSFTRGLLVGFGSIVGATLLIGLMVWLLSIFDGLPVVGQWFDGIQRSLSGSYTP